MSLMKTGMWGERERRKLEAKQPGSVPHARTNSDRAPLGEEVFAAMLYLERRRAERAKKHFVLMLVDVKCVIAKPDNKRVLSKFTGVLSSAIRETDIIGWYLEDNVIGVIGTELGETKPITVQDRMLEKVRSAFQEAVGMAGSYMISVTFHFFPEEWKEGEKDQTANIMLYPDLSRQEQTKKFALGVKRSMDIVGSAAAMIFLLPIYAAVAVAIKLTSKGPVFFRQERLGLFGKKFTLMKFRSMRTNCDARIHQDYVHQFIAGQVEKNVGEGSKTVFKIQKDPRVTPVGTFLRKTSLDELPQFWNVLRGDMSLVGPRPPIMYEFRAYNIWHRRRVLEIKPGITGLWQVQGRSKVRFDEMVRLDLKYARVWSIWLDLKILLQTPAAVFTGEGAH
jgi:lipopolysaccharide/colanic/teichoic acid biosynthesis glycosyltransferase